MTPRIALIKLDARRRDRIVMILTKDHTPTSFALGTTNSISELAQMIGIAIGAPFIRYVDDGLLSHLRTDPCQQFALRVFNLKQDLGWISLGRHDLCTLSGWRFRGKPHRQTSLSIDQCFVILCLTYI